MKIYLRQIIGILLVLFGVVSCKKHGSRPNEVVQENVPVKNNVVSKVAPGFDKKQRLKTWRLWQNTLRSQPHNIVWSFGLFPQNNKGLFDAWARIIPDNESFKQVIEYGSVACSFFAQADEVEAFFMQQDKGSTPILIVKGEFNSSDIDSCFRYVTGSKESRTSIEKIGDFSMFRDEKIAFLWDEARTGLVMLPERYKDSMFLKKIAQTSSLTTDAKPFSWGNLEPLRDNLIDSTASPSRNIAWVYKTISKDEAYDLREDPAWKELFSFRALPLGVLFLVENAKGDSSNKNLRFLFWSLDPKRELSPRKCPSFVEQMLPLLHKKFQKKSLNPLRDLTNNSLHCQKERFEILLTMTEPKWLELLSALKAN